MSFSMEDQIKKIREACITINPEIMQLKFGCKINIREDKNAIFTHMDNEYIYWLDAENHNCDEDSALLKDLNFEIIGRPIRLADVCAVLNGSIINLKNPVMEVQIEMIQSKYAGIVSCWNLLKDDLELQNEFTISTIARIIL